MSASNWAVCPRCLATARHELDARFEDAREAYGKVVPEEYERLRALAMGKVDPEDFRTFREDYEIYGADVGTVTVSYGGHCEKCNLGLDFKDERPFYNDEGAPE